LHITLNLIVPDLAKLSFLLEAKVERNSISSAKQNEKLQHIEKHELPEIHHETADWLRRIGDFNKVNY